MNDISSTRYERWQEDCTRLGSLSLAVYGGGEDFKLCSKLQDRIVSETNIESLNFIRSKMLLDASWWISNYSSIPKENKIAMLPQPTEVNLPFTEEDFTWRYTASLFQASSGDVPHYNILNHGHILEHEFDGEKERLGASAWPLIGLYNSHNIITDSLTSAQIRSENLATGTISQWTGHELLNPSDQHCHWVEDYYELDGYIVDLSSWNIGGDMGRFQVENKQELAFSWIGCLCPTRKLAQISWFTIIPAEYKGTSVEMGNEIRSKVCNDVWELIHPLFHSTK